MRLMPVGKFFQVTFVEPIPMIDNDFGDFSAGERKVNQELTFAYMPDGELAQWRFIPIDPVQVTAFRQPRVPKWVTKNTGGKLVRALDYANPVVEKYQTTEFFQFEDTKAFLDLLAPDATAASVIRFYGYRFMLEEVAKRPIYTTVWYEGRAPMA